MRIFPLGDNAITVEFGNEVSLELNRQAIALSEYLEAHQFSGFIETVPAYASTTVFYDATAVRRSCPGFPAAYDALKTIIERALQEIVSEAEPEFPILEIPLVFDDKVSLDLEELCNFSGLDSEAVIQTFLERTYRVYLIGFLPGFAYMGEVDERIAIPRKPTPRLKVPPGSVAIGGKQTGIYPLESPGGWHIIGHTKMKMFDPQAEPMCPLQAGQTVKFVRI